MKMSLILSTAIVAMSLSVATRTQSGKDLEKPPKNDQMNMTYTGCVQTVNHGATFLLTNVDDTAARPMHGDITMKSDVVMTKKEPMPMADAKMDAMASKVLVLVGSYDLKAHVGQEISVTGSLSNGSTGTMRQDLSTLTVRTLKVIAQSCAHEVRP
jgi:hypothetical protein